MKTARHFGYTVPPGIAPVAASMADLRAAWERALRTSRSDRQIARGLEAFDEARREQPAFDPALLGGPV